MLCWSKPAGTLVSGASRPREGKSCGSEIRVLEAFSSSLVLMGCGKHQLESSGPTVHAYGEAMWFKEVSLVRGTFLAPGYWQYRRDDALGRLAPFDRLGERDGSWPISQTCAISGSESKHRHGLPGSPHRTRLAGEVAVVPRQGRSSKAGVVC